VTVLERHVCARTVIRAWVFQAHRDLNIRRIGLCRLGNTKNGGIAICGADCRLTATRRAVREDIEAFELR